MCDGLVSKKALILSLDTIPTRNFAGDRLTPRHGEYTLDRRSIGRMIGGEPRSDRASGHGQWRSRDRAGIGRIERSGEGVEQGIVIGDEVGLAAEDLDDVTAGDIDQKWQDLMTNSIAKEANVGVGRILERCPAEFVTNCSCLVSSNVKEWMKHSTRRSTGQIHADETARARTPHEVDDDGFGPIICSVTGQNVGGKSRISSFAGAGLDVRSGIDRDPSRFERRTDTSSALGHQIGLVLRPGSKTVIDVNCRDLESVSDRQSQESEGIGTARHGTRHTRTSSRKVTAAENRPEGIGAHDHGRPCGASALGVPALLALTGETSGRDLLQISGTHGDHGENTDDRENDADPPVPNVCSEHG